MQVSPNERPNPPRAQWKPAANPNAAVLGEGEWDRIETQVGIPTGDFRSEPTKASVSPMSVLRERRAAEEAAILADMPNEDELEEVLLRAARGEFDRDLITFLGTENERLRAEVLRLHTLVVALSKFCQSTIEGLHP